MTKQQVSDEVRQARGLAALYDAMDEKETAAMAGEYADLLHALDSAKSAKAHKEASVALFEFRQKWRQVRDAFGTHPQGAIAAEVVTATSATDRS